MKTKLVLLFMAIFIGTSFSHAEELKTLVLNKVKTEIEYPDFAIRDNIEGEVLVSFKVDATGKFTVYQINSSSYELKQYVIRKIEKMELNTQLVASGEEHFHYRFKFDLQ